MDVKKARRDHRAVGFAMLAYLLLQLLAGLPFLYIPVDDFTAMAAMMLASTFGGGMAAALCVWWARFDLRPMLSVKRGLRRQTVNAVTALVSVSFFSGILVMLLNLMLESVFGVTATTADFSLQGDWVGNLLLLIAVVVTAPLFEELFFRGVLLGVLSQYGTRYGLIVSAMLFGLFHGNLPQGIGATIIGLVLGWLAQKTGSILPGILAHMLYNGFATLCSSGVMTENLVLMGLLGWFYILASIAATVYLIVLLERIQPKLERPSEEERALGWPRFVRCVPIWLTVAACLFMFVLSIQ